MEWADKIINRLSKCHRWHRSRLRSRRRSSRTPRAWPRLLLNPIHLLPHRSVLMYRLRLPVLEVRCKCRRRGCRQWVVQIHLLGVYPPAPRINSSVRLSVNSNSTSTEQYALVVNTEAIGHRYSLIYPLWKHKLHLSIIAKRFRPY